MAGMRPYSRSVDWVSAKIIKGTRLRTPLAQVWHTITIHLPPPNFIIVHYAYFIGVCLLSSVIFWGSSTPPHSVSYTDSLFLVVSAMTLAGLNTINLSQINTFQQVMLFLLIILGSAILVSIVVVHIRRKAFERKFTSVLEQKRGRGNFMRRMSFSKSRSREKSGDAAGLGVIKQNGEKIPEEKSNLNTGSMDLQTFVAHEGVENKVHGEDEPPGSPIRSQTSGVGETIPKKPQNIDTGVSRRITFASLSSPTQHHRQRSPIFSMQGVGARGDISNLPKRSRSSSNEISRISEHDQSDTKIALPTRFDTLSRALIGRNSQFSNLSLAEREELGGVEYRAVSILAVVVPLYFVLWQLLGCIGLGAYVANNRAQVAELNGENPWWVGAFNGVSAFNNSGMSLLDANMVAFQTADYMLITMSLMILAGNTCYPIFLRLILWTIWKLLPEFGRWHEHRLTLRFLLDHPRRCYTNLFPSRHTWWLVVAVVSLNAIDWAAFEVLNIGNPTVTSLPHGARVLDGLFQAFAVRSGGFYVVPIANLRIGLLILYVIMMYISVYPVVITMRSSNVYEERSLGIYAGDPEPASKASSAAGNGTSDGPSSYNIIKRIFSSKSHKQVNGTLGSGGAESRSLFVRQQLRGQLAHDIWWIVLAVLFICITETSQFERDPVDFSVFNVLFEVVSAYGCVGISVGLPNVAYSFCGGWHTLSKLILCAVMLRGRHRGLPVAIDRAVLLPGEHLALAEEEDAQIRAERTRAGLDVGGGGGVVGATAVDV